MSTTADFFVNILETMKPTFMLYISLERYCYSAYAGFFLHKNPCLSGREIVSTKFKLSYSLVHVSVYDSLSLHFVLNVDLLIN